jgi:rhamnosyltransferase
MIQASSPITSCVHSDPPAETAALMVLYNPNAETLKYIPVIAQYVDHLILIDNTPGRVLWEDWPYGIHYFPNQENLGIANALNAGIEKAIAMGINQIFLFDQDSRVESCFFSKMIKFKETCPQDTIICAPDFLDINTGTLARFAKLHRWTYTTVCGQGSLDPLDVTFVITSGSLLDIPLYRRIGPFREDYFIDHVDSEFCLRAATKGLKIIVNPGVVLKHAIGQRSLHRVMGIVIKPNHHNSVRRYYIARNGIRTTIDYVDKIPSILVLNSARLIHDLLGICFFEEDRWRKIRATGLGFLDGIRNHMGPAPLEKIM